MIDTRHHWHPTETLDLHLWIQEAADDACAERIRLRLDYLRWLHKAVMWEKVKEKIPTALMFAAWFLIPGSAIAILAYKVIKRRKTHAK